MRYEVQKRLAAFYLVSVFVGGFSNILAYGLMQMEGVGGQRGWQWIFVSLPSSESSLLMADVLPDHRGSSHTTRGDRSMVSDY